LPPRRPQGAKTKSATANRPQVPERGGPRKRSRARGSGSFLVTDHFLKSEFITRVELAKLLTAAKKGGVSIRWVPVCGNPEVGLPADANVSHHSTLHRASARGATIEPRSQEGNRFALIDSWRASQDNAHPTRRGEAALRRSRVAVRLKHDGFRALAYIDPGRCRLVSRNDYSIPIGPGSRSGSPTTSGPRARSSTASSLVSTSMAGHSSTTCCFDERRLFTTHSISSGGTALTFAIDPSSSGRSS